MEHASAATIDDGGWLKTGDLGYVDQGGYLYVVDRLKEMIKHRGMQVAPAELEAVLLVHPAIADAAMVASPYEETGELPKAFVVRAGEANAGEIMAYVAERVAPHKKVQQVKFVGEIPRPPTGKILRRVLIEHGREAMNLAD